MQTGKRCALKFAQLGFALWKVAQFLVQRLAGLDRLI
jgi:hypothetical protein